MFLQNFFDTLGGQRPQINIVGRYRIGHDRGRIGVNQAYFDALFPQGAACL